MGIGGVFWRAGSGGWFFGRGAVVVGIKGREVWVEEMEGGVGVAGRVEEGLEGRDWGGSAVSAVGGAVIWEERIVRPKTPAPTMRIEDGGGSVGIWSGMRLSKGPI